MNIFETLYDVIYYKRGNLLENIEDEKEFSQFMVQRWLSMYSPEFANILNCSTNVMWRGLAWNDKQEWYKLFISIIPKSSKKKIDYIKKGTKSKKEKKPDEDHVAYLANRLEISQREVRELLKKEGMTTKELKKALGDNTDKKEKADEPETE